MGIWAQPLSFLYQMKVGLSLRVQVVLYANVTLCSSVTVAGVAMFTYRSVTDRVDPWRL